MTRHKRQDRKSHRHRPDPKGGVVKPVGLRIIAGRLRRRKLEYSGNLGVRPMRDRVRQAVFNILGTTVAGTHVLDLFAGTGALALEAISRGALHATLIEQDRATAQVIRRNVARLGLETECRVIAGDVFVWAQRPVSIGPEPWLVFCSPPYAFYVDRRAEMAALIARLMAAAPAESGFVVESDERFDFGELPEPTAWDIRRYPPALVGFYFKSVQEAL
jgi:16S rRNA (guanine966-N2)-methyltransferase